MFLAAYRAGSLMGAAEALGISHSTVRRRLANLEAAMGTKLFTATPEGLVAADGADAAFAAAERIEDAVASFSHRLIGESRELRGSLIVTTVDGLAEHLAPIITRYAEQHPLVAVTLNAENRYLDLSRREADVAVRLTNTPDEHLFGRKVGAVDYAPCAAPALVERYGPRVAELPWILWDETARAVGAERWYAQNGGGRPPVARVTNAMTLMSLARAGLGGALLPVPLAVSAGLVILSKPIEGFRTNLWCLCHQDLRHSQRVRHFMDHVSEYGIDVGRRDGSSAYTSPAT